MKKEIEEALRPGTGVTLIITAGNSFRQDDGVGPYIASGIRPTSTLKVINAGYTPENIIEEAVSLNPQSIVFIDAADFNSQAGDIRLIPEESIPETTVSTHMIPLNIISRLIADSIKSKIAFIGIQPKSTQFGEDMCPEVKSAADTIVRTIHQGFGRPTL